MKWLLNESQVIITFATQAKQKGLEHMKQICHFLFFASELLLLFLFLSPQVLAQPVPNDMLCLDSIREIHLHDPHRALALLDTAEQRHTLEIQPYEIDMLRARCHNAAGEYYLMEKYAKRALASDSVQASPRRKLTITIDLIEALNARLQYEEAIRLCQKANELAQQLDDRRVQGQILYIMGGIYAKMQLFEPALKAYQEGIKYLENEKGVLAMAHLSTAYGQLMTLLMGNDRTKEAIETGHKREALVKKMSGMPGPPSGYIDQQYGYIYSKMAYLLQCDGQEKEAADYYRRFLKTDFSTQPYGQNEIIPYLLAAHRYAEALQLNETAFAHYAQTLGNDTINYNYLILLNRQAQALQGLRQYQAAYTWQCRFTTLQDSIHLRERKEQAQELATAFRLDEQERQLEQTRANMQRHSILLGASALTSVLLLALLVIIRLNLRQSKQRNKLLTNQLDELQTQRDELYKILARTPSTTEKSSTKDKDIAPDAEATTATAKEWSTEYTYFLRMEQQLTENQLFLQPDFGRDDLLSITHINKNDLPRLLRKYAHAENVSDYLNRLRVRHALKLMKEKPHFSIMAIGEEAGFRSRATFYRAFLRECGMTPTQYIQAYQ